MSNEEGRAAPGHCQGFGKLASSSLESWSLRGTFSSVLAGTRRFCLAGAFNRPGFGSASLHTGF